MMNSKYHGWSKRTREKYVFLRDLNVLHIHSTFSEHFKSFFLSWMIIQTLEMRKSWFNKWMRELRLVSVHLQVIGNILIIWYTRCLTSHELKANKENNKNGLKCFTCQVISLENKKLSFWIKIRDDLHFWDALV